MSLRSALLAALLMGSLILVSIQAPAQQPSAKTVILNVQAGQVPADTGMDDKTKPEIVSDVKDLGDKALKVKFAPGDSFGSTRGAGQNWKKHAFVRIDAVNPGNDPVQLEFVVAHARSSNYQTKVAVPITLKAGKNEVKIGIDEMSNVNGSAPDLTKVTKWYIGDSSNKGPLVYFGDIWLEGGETASAPATAVGAIPSAGFRVKGKIGSQDVDLTISPIPVGSTSSKEAPAIKVAGDPARLERLKSAKMPAVSKATMFDTPEADAILAALEVFPPDNPWNLVIENWPVHPNSQKIVASIGPNKPFRYNPDMGFVLVPSNQEKLDVKIVAYPGESDKGPFPVPENVPIEGWPVGFAGKKLTLQDVQRNVMKEESDRHAIVVDPVNRMLYEFYQMRKTATGWEASQSSVFDLKSNALRPEGWTSSDAAGLPVFPAVVRYDELKRGVVEHALRVTVQKTRRAYVYPATHFASRLENEDLPRMGERLRLRKDFDVTGFTPEVRIILTGLKRYGMLVADNGVDWAVSVAPDPRIPVLHEELRKVKGSDFEVVEPPAGYEPPK